MSRLFRWLAVLPALAVAGACRPSGGGQAEPVTPYVSEVPEAPGAAVEILVDCSGSMGTDWHGQPKDRAARQALQEALDATGEFRRPHPDHPIKAGVLAFSSQVREIVAVDMDAGKYPFIGELGGQVLQADDPAWLRAAVQQIYAGKILAEAVDAEAGRPAPEQQAPTPSSGSAQ